MTALVDWLATFPASAGAEAVLADGVLRRHSASQEALMAVWRHNVDAQRYGGPGTVTDPLADRDVIPFAGRRLRVHHLPGHSPSDTLFLDEDRGVLISADVLLGHVRSSGDRAAARWLRGPGGPHAYSRTTSSRCGLSARWS